MSPSHSIPVSIAALPARTGELAALLEAWSHINSGSGHLAGLERMRAALRTEFTRAFPAALVDEPVLEGTTARALRVRLRPSAPRQILLIGVGAGQRARARTCTLHAACVPH